MDGHNTARRPRAAVLAWLLLTAVVFTGGGFVVGIKWPIETVTQLVGPLLRPWKTVVLPVGWTTVATTDLPRYEVLRVRIGSTLYVFGGFHTTETKATARVESLDLRTGTWTRRQDMPEAITHANAVVMRDTVWIAGGFVGDHPGPATVHVWRYAIDSDTWLPGPALPAARGSGALVALHDTLHYFGGYADDRNTNADDHWSLAPGDSVWRASVPMPMPRGHLTGITVNGVIYAVGGSDSHDPVPIDVNTMQQFDQIRGDWKAVASTPIPISHTEPSTTIVDGRLVVVGGRSRPTGKENLDDIFLFDPDSARWTQIGHTPIAMLGGIAVANGDTLVVGLGAEVGNAPVNTKLWRRSLRDSWWSGTSMPKAVGEVSAAVIGNTMYVVGEGEKGTFRYDMSSGIWSEVVGANRPASGNHHAAEVVDGKLYLFGGLGWSSEGLVQIFDPQTSTWSFGPHVPFAAGAMASARIGDGIFVAGGIAGTKTVSSAAMLNLHTMQWNSIAPMPLPRNHAASATDGRLFYVFGGRGPGSGDANEVANGFDEVQVYDPGSDSWTVSSDAPGAPRRMPNGRGGTGKAVYLNGEFWILGGETLTGSGASATRTYARVDIYNAATNQWRSGPELPTARHGIFPVVKDGRIFVAGGGAQAGFSKSAVLEVLWPR